MLAWLQPGESNDNVPDVAPAPPLAPTAEPTAPASDPARIAQLKLEGEAAIARRATVAEAISKPADKQSATVAPDDVFSSDLAEEPVDEIVDEAALAFAERAEQRAAARAAARSSTAAAVTPPAPVPAPASPPTPVAAPSTPGGSLALANARSLNDLASLDLRTLNLPDGAVETFETNNLLVPSQLSDEEQDGWFGAVGASTGLLFLLPLFEVGALGDLLLSALVGGGLTAYAALRKDQVGEITRMSGKVANEAALTTYRKGVEVNDEYKLTEKAKDKAVDAVKSLTEKIKEAIKE